MSDMRISFTVARYSVTIARAHWKKAKVIYARSKENVSVFRFLIIAPKAKLQWIYRVSNGMDKILRKKSKY